METMFLSGRSLHRIGENAFDFRKLAFVFFYASVPRGGTRSSRLSASIASRFFFNNSSGIWWLIFRSQGVVYSWATPQRVADGRQLFL